LGDKVIKNEFGPFISHNSKDKGLAVAIYNNLFANGVFPWLDINQLRISDDLEQTLRTGIEQSSSFLFIASRHSLAENNKFVELELALARAKRCADPSFKIFILLCDSECELPKWMSNFLYEKLDPGNEPLSISRLTDAITGHSFLLESFRSFFLSKPTPAEVDAPLHLWDSALRRNILQLGQIRSLLQAPGINDEEIADTVATLRDISLFRGLPAAQHFWTQPDIGVYETIFARRMRVRPKITLFGLPNNYHFREIEKSEIHCVIEVIDNLTGTRVNHVVPFNPVGDVSFDAEIY
jgi:hypothetical protein